MKYPATLHKGLLVLSLGLAALPAHGALADAAVDEACWSFDQHIQLFTALEAFIPPR